MKKLFSRLLNITNHRKVNPFTINPCNNWRIYRKYLDTSILPNISSAVKIKISKNNLNRLISLKLPHFLHRLLLLIQRLKL
jgi:hypothetical protein